MNLYVVRHAIAAERGTPGFEDDSRRPLTDRGREKMHAIAHGLKLLETELQSIVSSPYVRARETAEVLAQGLDLGMGAIAFSEALLPMADPAELVAEIAREHRVDNLAVVGHEPHVSSLISYLLTGDADIGVNLKKGGVCLLTLDISARGSSATLEWLLTPRQLIAIAGGASSH
jgi:phosphohistidine phosphatase